MANSHETSIWDRLHARLDELSAAQMRKNDPVALAAKLANRARILRGRTGPVAPAGIPLIFLAFHKGGERYGVPIDDVLEVLTLDQFTSVPRTPPFIPGVVHWRGSILALLDPGKLFGIAESGIADTHACVIIEAAHKRIALVTGEVDDIHSVPREQIKPPPTLPGETPPEWFIGVHDENRLILRMDLILQDTRLENWKT